MSIAHMAEDYFALRMQVQRYCVCIQFKGEKGISKEVQGYYIHT